MRADNNVQLAISGTKLNQQLLETFVRLTQTGSYHIASCKAVGISYGTFRRWMSLGRAENDPQSIYKQFFLRVQEAEAYAEVYAVKSWRDHFTKDYRAPRDFLARRFPERWSERQKILLEVDNELKAILAVLESKLSPEIFGQVVSAIASAKDEVQDREGLDGDNELGDPFLDFEQELGIQEEEV